MEAGQKVRLVDVEGFIAEVRNKCAGGRVGEIVGFLYPGQTPIVLFPAVGRKKEFHMGRCHEKWLEMVVEDKC